MKKTTSLLIKLNPKYINSISDDKIDEETVLYALKCGFKFQDDVSYRYIKYFSYVLYNLKDIKSFINYLVNYPNFNINIFNKDNMDYFINYIKKNNPDSLIECVSKDISFLNYIDDITILSEIGLYKLNNILLEKCNYNDINKNILIDNIDLAILFIKKDFSNIIYIKDYIDISKIKNDILVSFFDDLENNIEYINEIVSLIDDNYIYIDDLYNVINKKGIKIDENTPKFLFNDKTNFSLLYNNLDKYYLFDNEINLTEEEKKILIKKIDEDNILFPVIPHCLSKYDTIVEKILKDNPYMIENKDFLIYDRKYYKYLIDNIFNDKYKISDNTPKDILDNLVHYSDFLVRILEKDFEVIKYFDNIANIGYDVDKVYEICKRNNYLLTKESPLFLKRNIRLIFDSLESKTISLNDIDMSFLSSFISEKEKLEFINYATKERINDNEIINKWKKELMKSFRKDNENRLYLNDYDKKIFIPDDITEIYIKSSNLSDINSVLRNTNSNVKVIVSLPSGNSFNTNYLNSIIDKNRVYFETESKETRFSVNDIYNLNDLMDLMVKDIKESNLSNYEKYIAVYDITKSFKDYKFYNNKESEDKGNDERNIYAILMNEWLVCVGYSNLLNELLKRVGINSVPWDVRTKEGGHQRNYVNIIDDKYGINGFYMCDATWDGELDNPVIKIGSNTNMTTDEAHLDTNSFDFSKDVLNDEIFRIDNIEDFKKYMSEKQNYVKRIIDGLDPGYYVSLLNKYNGVTDEFMSELFIYIRNKVNNSIEKQTTIEASARVQEFISGKKYTNKEFVDMVKRIAVENRATSQLSAEYKASINHDIDITYESIIGMTLDDFNNLYDKVLDEDSYKYYLLTEAYLKLRGINTNKNIRVFFKSDGTNMLMTFKLKNIPEIEKESLLKKIDGYEFKEYLDSYEIKIALPNEFINKPILELYQYANSYIDNFNEVYLSSRTK